MRWAAPFSLQMLISLTAHVREAAECRFLARAGRLRRSIATALATAGVIGTAGLNNAELNAVVTAAREREAGVRAHTSTREVILECLEAGVDIIDHGDYIDDQCIDGQARHILLPKPLFHQACEP